MRSILPHLRHSTSEECLDTETKTQKVDNYVTKVISELQPVEGTVAETYLKKTRKLSRLPRNSSLKFHPELNVRTTGGDWISGVPALVAVSGHPRSNNNNIQITYLDFKTGDKHPQVPVAKRTFGSFRGHPTGHHFCELMRNLRKTYSFVCEGVETALSVHQVFPDNHLIATLGRNNHTFPISISFINVRLISGKHNFLKLDPAVVNEKVVIILDNDGVKIRHDKVFNTTAKKLLAAGKKVFFVVPPLVDGLTKTDMNDVLLHHGLEAVNDVITKEMKKITLK